VSETTKSHHLTLWSLVLLPACVCGITSCERIAFYSTGRKEPETTAASGSGSSSGAVSSITRGAVLQSIAACHMDLLGSFREGAEAFETAAALAKNDSAKRNEARIAWTKAIDVWQRIEMFQFGPAGSSATPGGLSLRDHIYSWPLVSRCLLEQNIVSKVYANADFGSTSLVNMRGLAAAEYLLFYDASDNACSPATAINASGQWAALGPDELAARKAFYASVVASGVANNARTLEKAWSATGGNFIGQFLNAGSSGSVYTTEHMALNAVSDAMFYLELPLKDLKLARPLGLMDCQAATCPEAVESRFAGRSRTHIRNNLVGFRMLATGCEAGGGLGFDDLLESTGAGALAAKLTSNVDLAIAAADAVPVDDLAVALTTAPATVLDLHVAIKGITDLLKTEFVSVLDLEAPQLLEGDND
jgi:uncharacterized protein